MVKVKTELSIRVDNQINDPEIEPDYYNEFKFEDGCDCTAEELTTWISHQKKRFDEYIKKVFLIKYDDHPPEP